MGSKRWLQSANELSISLPPVCTLAGRALESDNCIELLFLRGLAWQLSLQTFWLSLDSTCLRGLAYYDYEL